MAADDQIKIVITAEDKASGVLNNISEKTGGLGNVLKTGLGVAVTGVTAAFGALGAVALSSLKAFDEQDKANKQLAAVLKSTHNAAGLFIEDLQDQAAALQRSTTFSDEAIESGQALLLTFTNIGGPVLQEATGAIADMSVAMGQDLKSSAIQVGKALNDPIEGINALRRVGVSFTEEQRDQIKTLVESGKTMDAQRMILAELGKEFGGSAAAAADTFGGKMTQLKNMMGELQETIGKALMDALMPFVTQLIEFAQRPEVQAQIQGIAQRIGEMATKLAPLAQQLIPALITGINIAIGVVGFLGKAFEATTEFLSNVILKVMQLIDAIKSMIEWVKQAIEWLNQLAQKTTSGIKSGVSNLGNGIANIFRAGGGPVSGGSPYIVGEEGPELFVPKSSGTVVPNGGFGGAGSIVVNITGTFLSEDAAAHIGDMLINQVKRELRI